MGNGDDGDRIIDPSRPLLLPLALVSIIVRRVSGLGRRLALRLETRLDGLLVIRDWPTGSGDERRTLLEGFEDLAFAWLPSLVTLGSMGDKMDSSP
jgi:hypothetical protein